MPNKSCLSSFAWQEGPTHEAECALRTYASSLTHLLAYERKLKEEAEEQKGETKLKGGHKKA